MKISTHLKILDHDFLFYCCYFHVQSVVIKEECYKVLTIKAAITTEADDKFCDIFPNFFCQQSILMKYQALFFILKKQQNLTLSSAAKYRWRFKVSS